MANQFIEKFQSEFDKTVEHFSKELAGLRAGRATPAMVENVLVEAYGVKTPMLQLASVSAPEPRQLVIEPWDKNLIKDIEKALSYANLGLAVRAEKSVVRVTVPQMTEENRRDLVKQMTEKLEAAKIAIRSVRDHVKEAIIEGEKNNLVTEDDRYQYIEELDKKVAELNNQLKEMTERKEKEIMTV